MVYMEINRGLWRWHGVLLLWFLFSIPPLFWEKLDSKLEAMLDDCMFLSRIVISDRVY